MSRSALILVDIQNDFLPPDGSLAVPGGRDILSPVHEILDKKIDDYDLVIASQDWHPVKHVSFASTHGKEAFTTIQVRKLHSQYSHDMVSQTLWPDHCVQGTPGSDIEQSIQKKLDALDQSKVKYVRKGTDVRVDAYSAFADNQYTFFTPLAQMLHTHSITRVVICGLATDYCVRATAIDARKFGFATEVLTDAVKAVDPDNARVIFEELSDWGCVLKTSKDLL